MSSSSTTDPCLCRRRFLGLAAGGFASLAARHGFPMIAQEPPSPAEATPRVLAGFGAQDAKPKRACIVLWMEGGPSQIDTFDPKPGRPTGGPFKAIDTAVRGARFSEHLPLLAKRAGRLCVVRSVTGDEADHHRATLHLQTGRRPGGLLGHPDIGSVMAHFNREGDRPGYVSIRARQSAMSEVERGPGFLGARAGPFVVEDAANADRLLRELDARVKERGALLEDLNAEFRREHPNENSAVRESLYAAARALKGSDIERALDLRGVKEEVLRPYLGPDRPGTPMARFGTGCLVARRLVEAGVPFVEVLLGGWDTHGGNFPAVQFLSSRVDAAFSALLDDLAAGGLLDSTLVVWMGEFGRTPQVNLTNGRDHYPRAFSAVLAGAGAARGRVVGETDADGIDVLRDPVTVPELFATIVHLMGVDPAGRYPVNEIGVARVADARPCKAMLQ